jgi:hypothetical protein
MYAYYVVYNIVIFSPEKLNVAGRGHGFEIRKFGFRKALALPAAARQKGTFLIYMLRYYSCIVVTVFLFIRQVGYVGCRIFHSTVVITF